MTELTQDQKDTLKRVKERQGKTTPAPWEMFYTASGQYHGISADNCDPLFEWEGTIRIPNGEDAELITDAPNLDDLAIAQAKIIEEQTRRIAELETELAQYKTPAINIKEFPLYAHGFQFRFSVSVLRPVEVNFGLAATKSEAEAKAVRWIAEVGGDINDYIDDYEDEDE